MGHGRRGGGGVLLTDGGGGGGDCPLVQQESVCKCRMYNPEYFPRIYPKMCLDFVRLIFFKILRDALVHYVYVLSLRSLYSSFYKSFGVILRDFFFFNSCYTMSGI